MTTTWPAPIDPTSLATTAALDAVVASIPPSSFVANGAYIPVATLLATYPADATQLGKYARVSDLWGAVRTVMTCEYDGASYYWRPQRTDYAVNNTSTSGTLTLVPLVTAPIVYVAGTLVGSMTVTPSATNVWPGATFEVISTGVLGIFGITISGLIGGGTLPLLAGGRKLLTYTSSGWRGG